MSQLGGVIRQIRKERGLTLQQLAEQAEVTAGFLSKIERGVNSPSFENVQKICYALGVSSDMLEQTPQKQGEDVVLYDRSNRRLIYDYPGIMKTESVFTGAQSFKLDVITVDITEDYVSARHATDEISIVISGVLLVSADGREHRVHPGEAIHVKADTEHKTRSESGGCLCYTIKFKAHS